MSEDTKLAYQLGIMQSEINSLNKSEVDSKEMHRARDKRIKALEDWRTSIVAICGAMVALAGFIGAGIVLIKDLVTP